MCDVCGCNHINDTQETKIIKAKQSLLKSNENTAFINKEHFNDKGILAVNLMSSPGSGKTTLLERTVDALRKELSMGVLEGDIETEIDAERIRKKGIPAVQITTGGACHLESSLIHKGFHALEHQLNGKKLDILFIENVGNLVCPSFFELGEHIRVVLVSVPEGSDKPLKYPKAFKTSHVFIITKSDLVAHFDFDIEQLREHALSITPLLSIYVLSAKTGDGLEEWFDFIKKAKNNNVKD
ncbi:MAG: hydrogenase nickel incorporation protein HypB [Thermodesulfovibrionia bacterium]|nr:hydrogenase nickel incorporation protein HypB [Thermodesulfovibrionia bacterium]